MMARADKLEAELKSIETWSPVQLRQSWSVLSGGNLPHASPSLLRQLIAHQLQEKALGKLPTYIERELDKFGANSDAAPPTLPRRGPILPGTRFVREWNGSTIAVTATEGGFEWDSDTYRSLSEIARKVTGAHWSGPRFFGLTAKVA
ncbi:MAG: hypothetical protein B7Y00_05200 [Sphingomonadales bacterium 17-56-6]|nr:MAG: hypothetical protein B7Y44_01590 [Sphingomonadales bacterium 28-55-16]OYZ87646.1 MAG: hypothetical protein B7Y00_05200 [Sphingomonadales bacterium 17-56-6]